jgi:hypothetical protein
MDKIMKWVEDTTHRFSRRPYYTPEELDRECDNSVLSFLRQKYGRTVFPLTTDDLVVMLEKETSDVDLYADFGGLDIEGETTFLRDARPAVKISKRLSLDESQRLRLRTALAHEYGHVHFHAFLWHLEQSGTSPTRIIRKLRQQNRRYRQTLNNSQSDQPASPPALKLKDDPGTCFFHSSAVIRGSPEEDWMEWQAAYAGRAILMPISPLLSALRGFGPAGQLMARPDQSEIFATLIPLLATQFDVSFQAVSTRLTQLPLLQ